jgi:ABC-type antimicrobial peptide transport system permease subunit
MLFGLEPTDPATLILAAAVMLAAGVAVGLIPGRRAASMDAVAALRVI